MYPPDHRCCDGSGSDGGAFGQFDAEALPFQRQTLSRQPEQCGGLLHAAVAPLRSHWLIEADDDLGGFTRAFGRGNRPA